VLDLKLILRTVAMKDKKLVEKQNYAHTVLNLKRVVNKLKLITEQQVKIDLLIA
jgi:hypothetical protein